VLSRDLSLGWGFLSDQQRRSSLLTVGCHGWASFLQMSFPSLPQELGVGLCLPCTPCLRKLPRKLPRLTFLTCHTLFAHPVRRAPSHLCSLGFALVLRRVTPLSPLTSPPLSQSCPLVSSWLLPALRGGGGAGVPSPSLRFWLRNSAALGKGSPEQLSTPEPFTSVASLKWWPHMRSWSLSYLLWVTTSQVSSTRMILQVGHLQRQH